MDIQANDFELRVFAQRQFALKDFAIRNSQRIPVPAFFKELALFLNFFVGTETF